jgi:TRAP transporter TAXI family solute receptor
MMKKYLALFLTALMLLSATACGSTASSSAESNSVGEVKQPRQIMHLVCGTSANNGTFYAYGGNWAKVMNEKVEGCDIAIEVSGGPTKNIQLIGSGDIDIGFTTGWMAGEAYAGTGEFKGAATDNAKAMFPMYSSVMYLYTLQGSSIKSIYDLEGKHVATGSPGGTSDKAGRALLEALGIKPSEISSLTGDTLSSAVKDGTVDAVFYVGSIPASPLLSIETTHSISFVEITDAEFDNIFSLFPFWTSDVMAAGTYKNQEKDVRMISFWNYAVCREDLDADLVYDLVKATFDNQKTLVVGNENFKTTLADNLSKITTELHPGAYRYYQEIGIAVPEGIIPR